tara:strand:- start:1205 stop:1843 length:639 start_codon:yes stop_codon:yes gene_type:complete
MDYILPYKLADAEHMQKKSLIDALSNSSNKLISTNLQFTNLKLNPIVYRLYQDLTKEKFNINLLWSDAGSCALAKRDMPDIKDIIFSYSEYSKSLELMNKNVIIIAINPQPFDYEIFEKLCRNFSGKVIMLNGKLEDAAIGIGNLGRERRKEFIYSWIPAFWLQPLNQGALLKQYDNDWILFKLDPDGYRYRGKYQNKPDMETITNDLLLKI